MRTIYKIKKLLREHRVLCTAYAKNNATISEVISVENEIITLHNNQVRYMQIKHSRAKKKNNKKIFKPNKEIKM